MGKTDAYDPAVFSFLVRKAQADEVTSYGEVASHLDDAVPTTDTYNRRSDMSPRADAGPAQEGR